LYDKFEQSFDNYYFNYPNRRTLKIHESHLNDSVLLGIRLIAFVYLTIIYLWSLFQIIKSVNTNIIFLTMLGFTGSWLYFGFTTLDYFVNGQPLLKKYHFIQN
jgi:hypothetical protein